MKHILVTGGAGYIGSHTTLLLLEAGYEVLVLDNFSNSSRESLRRVEALTGRSVTLIEGDIRDAALLDRLFAEYPVTAVIHFAGLKAVGESVAQPLRYYDCNVSGDRKSTRLAGGNGPRRGENSGVQFFGHGVRRSGLGADP